MIQTVKCLTSRQTVSTLTSGPKEILSFLVFLVNAYKHKKVDQLRYAATSRCLQIHQDLRQKWKPEVLFDAELQKRIFSAAPSTVTDGPLTFVMVPLVEMHLDRTKVVTQHSTNGVSNCLLVALSFVVANGLLEFQIHP